MRAVVFEPCFRSCVAAEVRVEKGGAQREDNEVVIWDSRFLVAGQRALGECGMFRVAEDEFVFPAGRQRVEDLCAVRRFEVRDDGIFRPVVEIYALKNGALIQLFRESRERCPVPLDDESAQPALDVCASAVMVSKVEAARFDVGRLEFDPMRLQGVIPLPSCQLFFAS